MDILHIQVYLATVLIQVLVVIRATLDTHPLLDFQDTVVLVDIVVTLDCLDLVATLVSVDTQDIPEQVVTVDIAQLVVIVVIPQLQGSLDIQDRLAIQATRVFLVIVVTVEQELLVSQDILVLVYRALVAIVEQVV